MNQKRRLPLGISDYRTIVDKNFLYIDKTKYIEKLEETASYAFLLRPRRFGKTLFTSTLEYYYCIHYKDEFDYLFGNTYIGQNPTEDRNSYYVLKFDFTALRTDSEAELIRSFRESTLNSFEKFCNKYNLKLDYKREGEPAEIFTSFMTKFSAQSDGEIFVIIDEYFHFANELLSFQTDLFSRLVSKTGFVKKWFESIKKHTSSGGPVGRFFATGVSPITLESLTSGFNIATDLTRHYWFNESLGFTARDVHWLIDKSLSKDLSDAKKEEIFSEMKLYYNGYLFNQDASERIFNSNMTLRYLAEYSVLNKPPRELLDTSVASDYSKMSKMFELKNKSSNYEVLQEIIENKKQQTIITPQFSLEKQFDKNDFRSLLFYLGYLTIDSSFGNSVDLVVPNYAVKELYFSYFEKMLKDEYKYDLDVSNYTAALRLLAEEGDNSKLISCIETILQSMSNRDAIGMSEKLVQTVCFTICMTSSFYIVESEREANKGYVDIQLMKRPGIDVNYYAILEFKYLPKGKETEGKINEMLADAKHQLERYNKAPKFKEMNNLKKWALVFVGDKCVRNEVV